VPVLTINGYAHNYEEVGSGPPLVYIAGTRFDSARAWVPYMREHATGLRVVLPDPRGMAGSAHTTKVEPSDWVADLGGLLDALGIPSVNLAAETFGTRIATRFAADYPTRVATLILNAPIAYSAPAGEDQRRQSADPANLPEQRRQDMERHHGADWPAVNAFYQGMHARPDFHDYYDLRTVAERVRAPTLVLRGDIDDVQHPIAHAVELHALLPTSWLAIYPNTPFSPLRVHVREGWDLIRRFIGEHTAAGPRA
jgi:pimeloyl-ACP methyl ester carboxylesterase